MNIIDVKHFIEKLIASSGTDRPTTATIIRINGNLADIQIGTSPVYLRNIQILGGSEGFAVGDEVALIWTEVPGSYGMTPIIQSSPNISISVTGQQLLAITEPDPFSRAGWRVTSDGMIYLDDTRLHPDGQLSMGSGDDIAVMSSANANYRFWAGAIQPASAPFSVSKDGEIAATAGEIANWNIETDQLYADSYNAILNASDYPYVGLGGATGYGEEGIWLGKDDDDTYKLYIGNPAGQHMYWDGSELYITGSFAGSTDMAGTSSTSWTINEDDANTDVITEFKHPVADGTITYDGTKFMINKPLEIEGVTGFEHILPNLNDTYDIGSTTLRWRKAYISEMESTLFAEDTVSAIGGWFLIPHSQGTLNEDVDNSQTQIDFGANSIEVDDFILLRGNSAVEYMQATSLVSGTTWNVTRNLDGSGANAWPEGHVYVVLGNTGDGRIELNAQTSGPQIGIIEQGSAYNQQTERLRLGDLTSWQTAGLSGYGWAAGDFSGNEFAYYSPATGMVMRGTINADDGYLVDLDISGTLDISANGVLKSVSSAILSADTGYYFEYNSGTPRFRIGTADGADLTEGIYWDGSSLIIEAANTTLDASGNLTATSVDLTGTITATSGELQDLTVTGEIDVTTGAILGGATAYETGEGFWLGKDGAEWKFFIGDAAGNKLTYDGTTLTLAGDGDGITNIDGGNIQTSTITSTQILANTIIAADIAAGTITANELAANTITGDKVNLNTYLAIGSATFGEQGIQMQYNAGTPRFYAGNGDYAYLNFDGQTLYTSNMRIRSAKLVDYPYGYIYGTGTRFDNTHISIDCPGHIQWPRTPTGDPPSSWYASVGVLQFVSDAPIPIGTLKATDLPMDSRSGSKLILKAESSTTYPEEMDTYIEMGSEGTGGVDNMGYLAIVVGGHMALYLNYDETINIT